MKSKKKLIIALSSFAFVLVAAVVTVTAVLAAANQAITSNVSVVYTAKQVAGTVTASYKVGAGSETSMGSVTYTGAEAPDLSKVLTPNANITLTADETADGVTVKPVVFTFTFTNTGSAAYTATLTYTDADNDDANVEMTTSANLVSNVITIPANTTNPITVTVTVTLENVALNAEFSGSFKWELAAQ